VLEEEGKAPLVLQKKFTTQPIREVKKIEEKVAGSFWRK
jgi:hypothetical protein